MSSQVHQTCSPAPPFAGAHLSSDPNWYPDIGATHHMTAMPLHNTQSYSAALIMSIWVMGPCQDGLYPLRLSSESTVTHAFSTIHSLLRHNRLGHPSSSVLARL
ncbi:hypothetical protein ACLB2K_073791 [Fragaria x ananassa]